MFTTNGLLFNKQNIYEIVESGVDIIRISLQGLTEEKYRDICGVKMNYEMLLDNLSYLYNKGNASIRVKIPGISLDDKEKDIDLFMRMFGDKTDSVFVEKILPMFECVDYEQIDNNIIKDICNGRQNRINAVCHRPFYRLRIAANGDVTAACCDSLNDFFYGNIYDESLLDLWQGKKHDALLRMQLLGNRFKHLVCKNCILPNDITTEDDLLDGYADEILARM